MGRRTTRRPSAFFFLLAQAAQSKICRQQKNERFFSVQYRELQCNLQCIGETKRRLTDHFMKKLHNDEEMAF